MADKPAPKKPAVDDMDAASRLGLMIGILVVISLFINRFGAPLSRLTEGGTSVVAVFRAIFESAFVTKWYEMLRGPVVVLGTCAAVIAVAVLWHSSRKIRELRTSLADTMALYEQKLVTESISGKNTRWEHVVTLANTDSPGDWRTAIIEADIMLDELLTSMGHHGDSLGDKLKGVEASDMRTLDAAWDAHKIRNRIAHSGSNFILTERETKRVIDLYRQVFEEFDYI